MSDTEILFEQRGKVGLVTLNRPKALNSLTHGMCLLMKAQLDAWKDDDSITCVVVQGAGERAFCAGGDIRALYESGRQKTSYALDFWRDEYILNAAIKHYPKPYISLLRGIVMGGGVGVSVHGRYRVADGSIVFAMPETGIGLFPDVGGSYFLSRLPDEIGMYLTLTGARFGLGECIHSGVATHAVPIAQWDDLIARLAGGATPESALAACASPAPASPEIFDRRDMIRDAFGRATVEAVLGILDRDGGAWASQTSATIRTKSPTSLKLSFRQLREGIGLDFDECMRMEYRMACRVYDGHDFYEGVRATIIDKDQKPAWKPSDLAAVSDRDIDAYFAPLGDMELPL